ncbi:MarR family winged helix-turn-helix transcriptional regulator [Sphingomonas sanguinis]|uniref:MarR family winged helix-turn-helix transcriptional regulator n=1 Tax=Sphingomonas sanguinis TaxID=33051 RepID=UPI0035A6FBFA
MESSLTALDVQTLLFVNEHPGCTLGDVARSHQVALTTMSSSIDRLVRRDMAKRERSEANRRTVALSITEKGEKVVAGYVEGYQPSRRSSTWIRR